MSNALARVRLNRPLAQDKIEQLIFHGAEETRRKTSRKRFDFLELAEDQSHRRADFRGDFLGEIRVDRGV